MNLTRADVTLTAIEALGALCIVVAAWIAYDGWRALAVFGGALVTLAQFLDRRLFPPN